MQSNIEIEKKKNWNKISLFKIASFFVVVIVESTCAGDSIEIVQTRFMWKNPLKILFKLYNSDYKIAYQ